MKTYRMNAVMAGALYFLGTAFGVTARLVGGEVIASISSGIPLAGVDMLGLIAANLGHSFASTNPRRACGGGLKTSTIAPKAVVSTKRVD